MNKIEKLIKEMCPNGVEYKRIEEICEIIVGGDKPKTCNKELTKPNLEYSFPIYSNNSKNDGLYGFSKTYIVNKKSVSISSIGTIGFHKLREPFYTPIIRLKILIPKNIKQITPEFLNYSLDMIDFSKIGGKQDTTLPSINTSDLQNIEIPVPPIEIQNEIVKILDTFTQLEAELEAELEARDKQYQYYRNKLLDFDNNQKLLQKLFEKDNKEIDNSIEWKCLSEVFEIKNGFTPSKNNSELWKNGTIPWFKLDDIRSNGNILFDSKIKVNSKAIINKEPFKENSIIISTTATIGEHALIKCKFICNQQFTIFSLNNVYEKLMNPKFIFYYFFNISNVLKNKTKNINLPIINIKEIKNMSIPIPSLEIQTKIVNILDKLQDYSKDIKTGLPLEIEQRQKQYEYYRDLLLDFKANAQGGGISE